MLKRICRVFCHAERVRGIFASQWRPGDCLHRRVCRGRGQRGRYGSAGKVQWHDELREQSMISHVISA